MSKPQTVGLLGAVAIGLASMFGAGVFSVFGLAYAKTPGYFYIALVLAALVAAFNASSVYALARKIDRPGGIYAYSREYLGKVPSFIAGVAFIIGKIGSIAAIAWIFGEYFMPEEHYLDAIGAIIVLTLLNILGINRTALAAIIIGGIVTTFLFLTGLLGVVATAGQPILPYVGGASGILPAASLLFFAFAGYARVATLGTEVRDAKRNIPRAIVISLSVVLLVYLLLSITLINAIGGDLDHMTQPVITVASYLMPWMPFWAILLIESLAVLGSMLALLAGVSRTAATMAEDRELPGVFAKRNRFGSPWLAEVLIAGGAVVVFLFTDYLQWIVGFSSFAVLLYYAIGHISVLRMPEQEREGFEPPALFGLLLCGVLLLSVPGPAVWLSSLILVVALAIRQVVSKLRAS